LSTGLIIFPADKGGKNPLSFEYDKSFKSVMEVMANATRGCGTSYATPALDAVPAIDL
jgi:hypothetical protein